MSNVNRAETITAAFLKICLFVWNLQLQLFVESFS